jgi:amino acid permease
MYMLGVVPGTLLMLAIAGMTYYTLARGLIYNSDALKARSYAALVSCTLGRRAEGVLHVAVFAT